MMARTGWQEEVGKGIMANGMMARGWWQVDDGKVMMARWWWQGDDGKAMIARWGTQAKYEEDNNYCLFIYLFCTYGIIIIIFVIFHNTLYNNNLL